MRRCAPKVRVFLVLSLEPLRLLKGVSGARCAEKPNWLRVPISELAELVWMSVRFSVAPLLASPELLHCKTLQKAALNQSVLKEEALSWPVR